MMRHSIKVSVCGILAQCFIGIYAVMYGLFNVTEPGDRDFSDFSHKATIDFDLMLAAEDEIKSL
jgi:hypothetical protein